MSIYTDIHSYFDHRCRQVDTAFRILRQTRGKAVADELEARVMWRLVDDPRYDPMAMETHAHHYFPEAERIVETLVDLGGEAFPEDGIKILEETFLHRIPDYEIEPAKAVVYQNRESLIRRLEEITFEGFGDDLSAWSALIEFRRAHGFMPGR